MSWGGAPESLLGERWHLVPERPARWLLEQQEMVTEPGGRGEEDEGLKKEDEPFDRELEEANAVAVGLQL